MEKIKTIHVIKQERTVLPHVNEERKKYVQMRKTLLEALKNEGKTIPQLSAATQLPIDQVTYYLMALQKFGEVSVEGIDDMDEYYIYQLKK